jgi:protein-tyrosine-phosphatase
MNMQGFIMIAQPPDVLRLLAHEVRWNLLSILTAGDRRVQELIQMLDQPANLLSYHLKLMRQHHLVTMRRSDADSRDVYYSLNLDELRSLYIHAGQALHPGLIAPGEPSMQPAETGKSLRVLFLCTHNSARSQMAEGLLRHFGGGQFEVTSAGSEPAPVHPDAVKVMQDMGIDISQQRSRHLDDYAGQHFDYVITVCDRVREVCPTFPDAIATIHWSIPDPVTSGENAKARQRILQDIALDLEQRIRYFLMRVQP